MRPIIAISILALSAAMAFSAYGQDSGNAFFRLQLTTPVLVTDEIGEDVAPPDGDEGNEISISIPSVTDGHVDSRIDGALDIPVLVSGIDETYTVAIANLPGASWVPDGAPHGSGSLVWPPSSTGEWTPVVEVRDADNNLVASRGLGLTIHGTLTASTPESVYEIEVGEELMITPTADNAIGNVLWGTAPSPLPAWLEFDDSTGNVDVDTSSPNAIEDVVLTAVDQFDLVSANTSPFSIKIVPLADTTSPVWVTAKTLPGGTEGEAYNVLVEATDNSGDVNVRVVRPGTATWLSFDERTQELSGAPEVSGSFHISLRAEDASGNYTDRTFTIEIEPAPDTAPPVWSPSGPLQISSIPTPVVGQPYSFQFTATDDSGTVTYHIEGPSGGYPEASYYGTEEGEIGWDQLTLDPETGVLSGTPYMAVSVMPSVYLWAEDSSGNRAFGGVVSGWSIKPAPDTTPPVWQTGSTLPDGIISQQYSTTVSATDENGSVRYELLDAELGRPSIDWLSIDATTGVLSGEAPPMSMSYWVTVRATDAAGNYADRIFSIFINCSGVGACP